MCVFFWPPAIKKSDKLRGTCTTELPKFLGNLQQHVLITRIFVKLTFFPTYGLNREEISYEVKWGRTNRAEEFGILFQAII